MNDQKVWVKTQVGPSDPAEQLVEGWETLPLWNRDIGAQSGQPDADITLHSASWGPMNGTGGTGGIVEDVYMVEVQRANGLMVIEFDMPRHAMISDDWELVNLRSNTLLVDLLPPGCLLGGGPCPLDMQEFIYNIEYFQ